MYFYKPPIVKGILSFCIFKNRLEQLTCILGIVIVII
ncbi:hypothetical protein CBU_0505a [Coxiella burnetii RSA 493]|uniref:Uncharacterized protein n=1 Tax=Coxiella burnetii (strain RSA 493 / Nine Mile phase I) TaxID=227377 RepID=B5QS93_COXBU|nr:hypothetical protein CBU_0505a [Coxiella burnetii RSA 493]BBL37338.1 hypothetical protein CBU406_C14410 [Coxiella burnetii]BBL38307.1 hypothetical protein CBUVS42_C04840 [Coxiella burnetii]